MRIPDTKRSQLNWSTEAPTYKIPRQSYTPEFKQEAARRVKIEGKVSVKYAVIDPMRRHYPRQSLCKRLSVSTSGFADWQACGGPSHWLSDAQRLALIRSIHAEVQGAYGSPCIYQELRSRGHPVSKARIQRLMQKHGLRARHKRRYKATTNSKQAIKFENKNPLINDS